MSVVDADNCEWTLYNVAIGVTEPPYQLLVANVPRQRIVVKLPYNSVPCWPVLPTEDASRFGYCRCCYCESLLLTSGADAFQAALLMAVDNGALLLRFGLLCVSCGVVDHTSHIPCLLLVELKIRRPIAECMASFDDRILPKRCYVCEMPVGNRWKKRIPCCSNAICKTVVKCISIDELNAPIARLQNVVTHFQQRALNVNRAIRHNICHCYPCINVSNDAYECHRCCRVSYCSSECMAKMTDFHAAGCRPWRDVWRLDNLLFG